MNSSPYQTTAQEESVENSAYKKAIGGCLNWGSVYHSVDTDEFPVGNYLYTKYGKFTNWLHTGDNLTYKKAFFEWFFENVKHTLLYTQSNIDADKYEDITRYVYELDDLGAIALFNKQKSGKTLLDSNPFVHLYYTDVEKIAHVISKLKENVIIRRRERKATSSISLIRQRSNGGLDTTSYEVKIGKVDISLNYGEKFIPVYNNIVKKLNEKDGKGIVLFHGEPGTGKTSIIKYLTKKVKKEIIFVPPSMAEAISSPSFIPFLMEHSNSVLVLEDAERLLASREGSNTSMQSVANLLNVSDGILGDCLNIQIIATFNTNLKNIDEAFLRKGRLIAEHEFDKLSVEESNKLLKHLGKSHVTTKPMKLTDIYNIDEKEFKKESKYSAIGFNAR